jgi:hypothetical protein
MSGCLLWSLILCWVGIWCPNPCWLVLSFFKERTWRVRAEGILIPSRTVLKKPTTKSNSLTRTAQQFFQKTRRFFEFFPASQSRMLFYSDIQFWKTQNQMILKKKKIKKSPNSGSKFFSKKFLGKSCFKRDSILPNYV